eukprot:5149452-Pyramimonas_sp.AAC.2
MVRRGCWHTQAIVIDAVWCTDFYWPMRDAHAGNRDWLGCRWAQACKERAAHALSQPVEALDV